jgi:hypothetical protein
MPDSTRLSLNIGWVLASWSILIFAYYMRLGFHSFVQDSVYISIGCIATLIFLLPDYLASKSNLSKGWTKSPEFYTLILIGSVSGMGLIFGNTKVIPFLSYVLWGGATIVFFCSFVKLGRKIHFPTLIITVYTGFLLALDLYHHEGLTPLFYERMIFGKGYVDTLSHTAISHIFATHGVPSIGADGLIAFKYHWGSHLLLGGIAKLISSDTITVYNIFYPAVVVILLFKTGIDFVLRLGEYYGKTVHPFPVLLVASMLTFVDLLIARPYLWMESATFANAVMFLFVGVVFAQAQSIGKLKVNFILFSLIMLIVITSLKISHGFVLVCALSYVTLRIYPNMKTLGYIFVGGLIILLFVLRYILLIESEFDISSDPLTKNAYLYYLGRRVLLFWHNSGYPWTYMAGLIIFGIVWLRKGYFKSFGTFIQGLKRKDTLELEGLLIINLSGFAGALYVSEHALDVLFFMITQLLLSVTYVLYHLSFKISKVDVSKWVIYIVLIGIIGFGTSTKTYLLDHIVRKNRYQIQMTQLKPSQQLLSNLLIDLQEIPKEYSPATTAVYIAQSEHWYHNSQEYILANPFIAQSISGFVSIGGISETIYYSSTVRYGFDEYRQTRDGVFYEFDQIQDNARNWGFERLIVYKADGNNLIREVVEL